MDLFRRKKNGAEKKPSTKPVFFNTFNTSRAFGSGICFTHLSEGSCGCKSKEYIGKVRSLREFYERIVNYTIDNIIKKNDELEFSYTLDPNVKKLAKMYDEKYISGT
jgi:hypothetical protein